MIKDNKIYLEHIKDAINQINKYSKDIDHDGFIKSRLVQDATIRQLEIIGEATKNLSEDFRNKYKNIPWRNIAGMRDKLIHGYMGVDLEDVWKTIKEDIPTLSNEVNIALKELN